MNTHDTYAQTHMETIHSVHDAAPLSFVVEIREHFIHIYLHGGRARAPCVICASSLPAVWRRSVCVCARAKPVGLASKLRITQRWW